MWLAYEAKGWTHRGQYIRFIEIVGRYLPSLVLSRPFSRTNPLLRRTAYGLREANTLRAQCLRFSRDVVYTERYARQLHRAMRTTWVTDLFARFVYCSSAISSTRSP
jgi:hypothetical protein